MRASLIGTHHWVASHFWPSIFPHINSKPLQGVPILLEVHNIWFEYKLMASNIQINLPILTTTHKHYKI